MHESTDFSLEIQAAPGLTCQVDQAGLRRAITTTLRREGAPRGSAVTLVISDDEEIHRLNRQFRQVDAPTDVLAFPPANNPPFVEAPEQPLYLGDIVVSYPRAVDQATEAAHPVEAELALLVVHGTLHLLGHDHATSEGKATMWAAQQAVLAELGFESSALHA